MQDPATGRSPFPPIGDYGFLSDCETVALVAPSGNVEWLCSPRPDGRSVFASMLDRAAGSFRLGPTGVLVPAGRRYLPGLRGESWARLSCRRADWAASGWRCAGRIPRQSRGVGAPVVTS